MGQVEKGQVETSPNYNVRELKYRGALPTVML